MNGLATIEIYETTSCFRNISLIYFRYLVTDNYDAGTTSGSILISAAATAATATSGVCGSTCCCYFIWRGSFLFS